MGLTAPTPNHVGPGRDPLCISPFARGRGWESLPLTKGKVRMGLTGAHSPNRVGAATRPPLYLPLRKRERMGVPSPYEGEG